ncbi:TetR/AcrR family transcriptional regulator [Rhodococcoides fascians]|uniref:TetR/AcrR family transcriptional regulator n=1 Tax=Rhodococcoides fascians TaxID=1828 RepID=UPI00055F62EC|nr:TetR/AcrR family transcriptional regulator [Rhodococcus fascians]
MPDRTTTPDAPTPRGRKRDQSRDGDILDATVEVLAEHGYDGMTMDMVAARAKAGKATVYRRWPSKAHMIVDAVARVSKQEVDVDELPDTGTLRGDLKALMRPEAFDSGNKQLKIMSAVASMLAAQDDPELAASISGTNPWIAANRIMIERAVARAEIAADTDVEFMARVIPAMCYYRVTVEGRSLDPEHVLTLIDTLLLPALTNPSDATEGGQ